MDNNEKLAIMDKIIRELADISNSSTALLKKVSQVEAENINLGDKLLEDKLPDLHEKIDAMVTETTSLIGEFTVSFLRIIEWVKLGKRSRIVEATGSPAHLLVRF
jgi:hypothetical protein